MDMDNQKEFRCPLCESLLDRDHWIKITGQWKEIEKDKENQEKLIKKYQSDIKKASAEAEKVGMAKGVKRAAGFIQNKEKAILAQQKRIQDLERKLKVGNTPQAAGFDYEKEVAKLLSENFPDDDIKATGKLGDNIQYVKFNKQDAGSIIYECKKTETFSNSFIAEIQRHQETASCTYAVIVTHAPKKGKQSFFVEEGIIVVDPFGLLDIASLLRGAIVEMHQLKLTKAEISAKSLAILKYMQTGDFKNRMQLTIQKSEDAYNLLLDEMNEHKKTWTKRYEIYSSIHSNVQIVRAEIGKIITGNINLPNEVKQLETPKHLLQ